MAIGDDLTVALNGDIRHDSGVTTYTGLELHRWLSDLADDEQASGDDFVDITTYTPSERATDQIFTLGDYSAISGPTFNIDDTCAQFIYNCSIAQKAGDEQYSGLVMVGTVETGTQIQVIQEEALFTSYWTTGLNAVPAENILNQVLIKSRSNGADLDGKRVLVIARELGDTFAEFSVTLGDANSVAAIFTSSDLNNQTAGGTISGWTITNTEGYQTLDIPQDGSSDPFYSQWDKGTQSINDLFEYTKYIQRRTTAETIHGINGILFRGITHEIIYDGEAGTGPVEDDLAVWGTTFSYGTELGALSVGEYYTFSSGAVGKLLALDDDGATGTVIFAKEPGSGTIANTNTFVRSDGTASDGATVTSVPADETAVGGRGLILADDTSTKIWIQLLSGAAPVNNLPMYNVDRVAGTFNVADVFTVNVTVTARTVSPEFIGQSTGSNLIGAYGLGVVPSEAVVGDKYTDLGTQLVEPPNNVTFSVGGLVSGEDRILVTRDDTDKILFAQYTLQTTLNTSGQTSVVLTGSIDSDTPSTGVIRVELDTGVYRYIAYTGWSGSTFTTASTDWTDPLDATAPANVFVGFIDKLAGAAVESFTVVYNTDRTMFIRVRDGGTAGDLEGIKTFETTAVLGDAGGGTTAIRTSDA